MRPFLCVVLLASILIPSAAGAQSRGRPPGAIPSGDRALTCAAVYLVLAQSAARSDPSNAQSLTFRAMAVERIHLQNYPGADPAAYHAQAIAKAQALGNALAAGTLSLATISGAYQTCDQLYPQQ